MQRWKKQLCKQNNFSPQSTVGATGARKEDQDLHQAPKELPGPNLSDLIHDKEKLEQFWAFLNKHSARYVSSLLLLFYLFLSLEEIFANDLGYLNVDRF